MSDLSVTIAANGRTVTLDQRDHGAGLFVEKLDGWHGTPSPKVGTTERTSGDGAHAVAPEAVLYSSRVVTIGVAAYASDRPDVVEAMDALGALAHAIVDLTVTDGGAETSARGYLSTDFDAAPEAAHMQRGTITVVCADPRRYGAERSASIVPTGDAGGGLLYDDGAGYLLLPIQFGGEAPTDNSATVANGGTSTAYPTITVSGDFPSGLTISHAGGELAYPAPIGTGAPLVLDSLTRTASVLGVDVTRALTRRDFPTVPAGGSVTLSALAEGTGTVTVTTRDTYI